MCSGEESHGESVQIYLTNDDAMVLVVDPYRFTFQRSTVTVNRALKSLSARGLEKSMRVPLEFEYRIAIGIGTFA